MDSPLVIWGWNGDRAGTKYFRTILPMLTSEVQWLLMGFLRKFRRIMILKEHSEILTEFCRFIKVHDQTLLAKYVWPWAEKVSMQHDSFNCRMFPGSIGFPTPRQNTSNNFVGAVVNLNWTMNWMCPRECRRSGHQHDWEYCWSEWEWNICIKEESMNVNFICFCLFSAEISWKFSFNREVIPVQCNATLFYFRLKLISSMKDDRCGRFYYLLFLGLWWVCKMWYGTCLPASLQPHEG